MSSTFTCFPHGGGTSVVDYIMGSPALASQITDFSITPPLLGADHTYLLFHIFAHKTVAATTPHHTSYHDIHFDHLALDYSAHLASLLTHIDTIPSLDHRATLSPTLSTMQPDTSFLTLLGPPAPHM